MRRIKREQARRRQRTPGISIMRFGFHASASGVTRNLAVRELAEDTVKEWIQMRSGRPEITYKPVSHEIVSVFMLGRHVGSIKRCLSGWRYFPKGCLEGGESFETLAECKRSLECDSDSESAV